MRRAILLCCLLASYLVPVEAETLQGGVSQEFDSALDRFQVGTYLDEWKIPYPAGSWYQVPLCLAGTWDEKGIKVWHPFQSPHRMNRTMDLMRLGLEYDKQGGVWGKTGSGPVRAVDQYGHQTVLFEVIDNAWMGTDSSLNVEKHGRSISTDRNGIVINTTRHRATVRYECRGERKAAAETCGFDASTGAIFEKVQSKLVRVSSFMPMDSQINKIELSEFLRRKGRPDLAPIDSASE